MIVKSYEIKKEKNLLSNNFYLLYGENLGLKKDIKNFIAKEIKKNENVEVLSFFESEIIENDENFYNFIYSGSLFSSKKIVIINQGSEKILKIISDIYQKFPENIFLFIFSEVLEKKSKLRNFFEKKTKTICIPCYLDNEKDLRSIATIELQKNSLKLSTEIINLIIEKSNSDRNNLRNEIEKIIAYTLNKKRIDLEEIKLLVNFSGDYKTDVLINECLCGNISQYKKALSELYTGTINQILFLRVLSNKVQRLLKIKEQQNSSHNLDFIINSSKPLIFWKEKPMVKRQLSLWSIIDLKNVINEINNVELLCKKNPQVSNNIFLSFFSSICIKANNFSL